MVLFFVFSIAVIVCIALMPVLMRYAGVLNMLDQPDARKVHAVTIPRCGGIGLAFGAIIAIFIFEPAHSELFNLIIGAVVILLFGLLDDRFELSYKWKFLGQIIAVFFVIYGGIHITFVPFLGLDPVAAYITFPLTLVFVVGVTNAVNLSDGLDGLAAGIMLMTLSAIAFLAIDSNGLEVAIMSLAVAGGIVGFLWFNTHPAVVFMGDTGSQFIGFMAVFLAIYLTQELNPALNPALPLLLLGLPILDTLSVMVRRIRAGRSPFSPDKTHIHHRLMEYSFTHAEAVGSIYILQGVFLTSALYFRYASDLVVIVVYLAISASILLFFYWAGVTKWHLHSRQTGRNRRGRSIWRNEKLFHFCRHYINISIAIFLATQMLCLVDRVILIATEWKIIMLFAACVFFIVPKYFQDIWVRLSVYIAAIFANVMGQQYPEMQVHTHWVMDVFLFVLIVVVSIAIRITRQSKFRMTTQDVLVMLFTIAAVLLVDYKFLEHVTLRLFCLVYALEYLLHRDFYKFRLSRYFAAASGILIMAVVLPSFV